MGKMTWLTPFVDAWKSKTLTTPNCKRLAKELGIIKANLKSSGVPEKQIHDRLLKHWQEYVHRTPVVYLSPTRFRETFKYWDPEARYRADVDRKLDAEQKRKPAERRNESVPTRLGDILEMPKP
jgi:hypothetical protein